MDAEPTSDSWGTFQGQEYLSFAPLFGHQYSHVWIDFRGIQDDYMRERGIDYFENSRRATYAQRAYAIANPMGWKGYGENVWGLTASDGPQRTMQEYNGEQREFRHYSRARRRPARCLRRRHDRADRGDRFAAVRAGNRDPRDRGDARTLRRAHLLELRFPRRVQPELQLRHAAEDRSPGAGQGLGGERLHRHRPGADPGDDRELPQRIRLERDEAQSLHPRGLERAGFTGGWLAARGRRRRSKPAAPPRMRQRPGRPQGRTARIGQAAIEIPPQRRTPQADPNLQSLR